MVMYSKPMPVPMAAFPSMPVWIPGTGGYGHGVPGSPPLSFCSSGSGPGLISPPPVPQFWHSLPFYNPGGGGATDGFQSQGGGFSTSPPMTNYGFPALQFQGFLSPHGSPPTPTYGYEGSYSYSFPNNLTSTSGDGQAPQGFQNPNFNPGSPSPTYVYLVPSSGFMYANMASTSEVTSELITNLPGGEATTFYDPGMKPPRKARSPKQRKPKKVCTFCVQNKETDSFCQSHTLKNPDFTICCPILRKYVCPLCKATGDDAHTIKYCPENKGHPESNFRSHDRVNEKGAKKPKRNARGVVGSYHYEKI